MLIGIMSDTHGRFEAARMAMKLFQSLNVKHVVHCGDVGGLEVFDELLALPLTFVWGNTDFPDRRTFAYLESVGLNEPSDPPLRVDVNGKSIAVFHGHESGFRGAARGGAFDYLMHGHTHERRDERMNGTRIINPGALHRARIKTVATLDPEMDALTFHEVDA